MALNAPPFSVTLGWTRLATFNALFLLSAYPALKTVTFHVIGLARIVAMLALRLLSVFSPHAGAITAQLHVLAAVKRFAAITAGVPAHPAYCSGRVGHSPGCTYDAFASRMFLVTSCAILRH